MHTRRALLKILLAAFAAWGAPASAAPSPEVDVYLDPN